MLSKARITILAVCGAIAMTGAAEAAAKPKLTIKGPNGDFQGTIKSKKRKCMKDREVTVYRQLGNTKSPSTDDAVASDTSSLQGRKGRWETGNTGLRDGKRYYAHTPRIKGCKAAISKSVRTVLDVEL